MAIVLTDLLIGILIGLAVEHQLHSQQQPAPARCAASWRSISGGDVLHIELANQVSFLNRAALSKSARARARAAATCCSTPSNTDYIDPDVLDLIRDFKPDNAPARGVEVSFVGFRSKYQLRRPDPVRRLFDARTADALTPQQVLQILKDGHERFRTGQRLTRDLGRQVDRHGRGQHPLAVVLSCIDSRTPAELIFDLGVGDIFSVRIAGNVTSRKVLGSMEYGCAVAGAKLIVVMGHTRCGAVTAAVDLGDRTAAEATGCQHLDHVVDDIQQSTDPIACRGTKEVPVAEKQSFVDAVARRNVLRVVERMRKQSQTLDGLVREGRIAIMGAMYDVVTGEIEFLAEDGMHHCRLRNRFDRESEENGRSRQPATAADIVGNRLKGDDAFRIVVPDFLAGGTGELARARGGRQLPDCSFIEIPPLGCINGQTFPAHRRPFLSFEYRIGVLLGISLPCTWP